MLSEAPAKFQSDETSLTIKLVASRLFGILRLYVSRRILKRLPGRRCQSQNLYSLISQGLIFNRDL